MAPDDRATWLRTCEVCGKRCFTTRRLARTAARQFGGKTEHFSVYRCGPWWHYGHIPPDVTRGTSVRGVDFRNRKLLAAEVAARRHADTKRSPTNRNEPS